LDTTNPLTSPFFDFPYPFYPFLFLSTGLVTGFLLAGVAGRACAGFVGAGRGLTAGFVAGFVCDGLVAGLVAGLLLFSDGLGLTGLAGVVGLGRAGVVVPGLVEGLVF
jgi:hypothetical protein